MSDAFGIPAALSVLESGGVVGVPTDTVYGLAVDPRNETALKGLFDLKARDPHNPIALLAASIRQAAQLADFSHHALELAVRHWPGPLTLVVPKHPDVPEWIGDRRAGTVGVRVPDNLTALRLLAACGPLAVSSANPSGRAPAGTAEEAEAAMGDAAALYLRGGRSGGASSTVVAVIGNDVEVLRPGPVKL